jgi:hypothetical protein
MLNARRYGPASFELYFSMARAQFLLGNYVEALREANQALSSTADRRQRADVYAVRALVYETTIPPLINDAITNWQWVLSLEEARPEVRALAEAHLSVLLGGPTLTPTLTPTVTPGGDTGTPSLTPSPGAT